MQSDFYVTLRPYTSGQALHAVFNTTEESILKQIKPPIAPLFNISSAATLEPLVDEVLECIRGRFDERFVGTGQIFDMGQWLQFFAFDVMGTMTFSKRYGFLDKGRDVGGMLGAIVDFMRTAAPVRGLASLIYLTALITTADDPVSSLGQITSKECSGRHTATVHKAHRITNNSLVCWSGHQGEEGENGE